MNKTVLIFTVLISSLSCQVFADDLRDSNRLFDWAERAYPQYFNPTPQETFNALGYFARHYKKTETYLGTKDGRVYVLGDTFGGLVDVGELSYFLNLIDSVEDVSFNENFSYPDGVVNRTYSFALEPDTGSAPFSFTLLAGSSLPSGVTLDNHSGLIQGIPAEIGYNEFSIRVNDVYGKSVVLKKSITIYEVLSFGEHGTFKGCSGLQMALNASQDLNEIRIEQGTYECTGLTLASNKKFEHGIKISGGWGSSFEHQSDDPALTIFDAKTQVIKNINNAEDCDAISGIWESYKCFQEPPLKRNIMFFGSLGPVKFEMMSFHNAVGSGGNAIWGGTEEGNVIDNCIFVNNTSAIDLDRFPGSRLSGAVIGMNIISNSSFINNSTSSEGGAIYNTVNILNSTFVGNKASSGGAAFNVKNIIKSTFTNNSALGIGLYLGDKGKGGAIFSNNSQIIENSNFIDNHAISGGAIYVNKNKTTISNSIFSHNRAILKGGAIATSLGSLDVLSSILNNNIVTKGKERGIDTDAGKGGAIFSMYSINIINSVLVKNSTPEEGGALYGGANILNSIFYKNTANSELNDITPRGELSVDYTLANYIDGVFDYGAHNIMGDPRFIDLENDNYRLSSDSPAIDMGDPSVLELYEFPTDTLANKVDLDGNQRIIGNSIDIGAYEYQ